MQKRERGITLIALIITIIILLILAAISIKEIADKGLIEKSNETKIKANYIAAKEIINIHIMNVISDCYADGEEVDLIKINKEMEQASDITVEKKYIKNVGTIQDISEFVELNGIVVVVDQYPEYHFLIGENNEIEAVIDSSNYNELTEIVDFISIKNFENELGMNSEKITSNVTLSYKEKSREEQKFYLEVEIEDRENGILKIINPDGSTKMFNAQQNVSFEYEVEFGKEYKFKIISGNGAETIKNIKIETYICKIETNLDSKVHIDNENNEIEYNNTYEATLSVDSGYILDSITVTMGNKNIDVDNTTGKIYIENVSDDIVIIATSKNSVTNSSFKYLIAEVYGSIGSNGASVGELEIYNSAGTKLTYTPSSTEHNCGTWYNLGTGIWGYTHLYDGKYQYTSNEEGRYNCTFFSTAANNGTARFLITLSSSQVIGNIRVCVGDNENRTPKKISLYGVNNYTSSTNSTNIQSASNTGLTLLKSRTFTSAITTATWYYLQ